MKINQDIQETKSKPRQARALTIISGPWRISLERKMFFSFSLHDLHILCSYYTWKRFSRPVPGPRTSQNRSSVRVAVVMPHSFFNGKEYQKKMFSAANRYSRLEFTVPAQRYNIIEVFISKQIFC